MSFHQYTAEQHAYLRGIVPGRSHIEITNMFNTRFNTALKVSQIKSYINNKRLNTGRTGRYPKGNIPQNKGRHGPQYGWPPTQFKKGCRPHNYKPVGTERINTDGYIEIKTADPNKWRGAHTLMWEAAHGPVPKGYVVIFGDSNRRNLRISNLLLVSRAELAVLNKRGLIGGSAELTRTGVLLADVIMKRRERIKEERS